MVGEITELISTITYHKIKTNFIFLLSGDTLHPIQKLIFIDILY